MTAFDPAPTTQGSVLGRRRFAEFTLTDTRHCSGRVLPRHVHERATITIPLRGTFIEAVERERYHCQRGSVLYKAAGTAHENRYGQHGARSLIIELSPALVSAFETRGGCGRLQSGMITGLPWVAGLRLSGLVTQVPAMTELVTEEVVCEIFDGLLLRTKRERGAPAWLERVRDQVAAEWEAPPSLTRLAASAEVHPVYLARVFRRHYGCSVGEFVLRRRLDEATVLLMTTDQPVCRIGLAAGFYDQSHFTRSFRAHTGCTPAAFRRAAAC